jgi:hypothetical protein
MQLVREHPILSGLDSEQVYDDAHLILSTGPKESQPEEAPTRVYSDRSFEHDLFELELEAAFKVLCQHERKQFPQEGSIDHGLDHQTGDTRLRVIITSVVILESNPFSEHGSSPPRHHHYSSRQSYRRCSSTLST